MALLFLYYGARIAVAIDYPDQGDASNTHITHVPVPNDVLPPEHPVFATIVVVCMVTDHGEASRHVSIVVVTYANGKSLRLERDHRYGLDEQGLLDYGRTADDFQVWAIGCPT